METGKLEQTGVNKDGTILKFGTKLTRGCSGPVHFELVRWDGVVIRKYLTAKQCAELAKELWPDQEQDEDRTGNGWDIAVVGAE